MLPLAHRQQNNNSIHSSAYTTYSIIPCKGVVGVSIPNIAQYILFLLIVLVLVKPVGGYMAHVFTGERTFLDPALRPVEHLIYKITKIDAQRQMDARQYTIAFLVFSLVGTLLLYLMLRLQTFLPW